MTLDMYRYNICWSQRSTYSPLNLLQPPGSQLLPGPLWNRPHQCTSECIPRKTKGLQHLTVQYPLPQEFKCESWALTMQSQTKPTREYQMSTNFGLACLAAKQLNISASGKKRKATFSSRIAKPPKQKLPKNVPPLQLKRYLQWMRLIISRALGAILLQVISGVLGDVLLVAIGLAIHESKKEEGKNSEQHHCAVGLAWKLWAFPLSWERCIKTGAKLRKQSARAVQIGTCNMLASFPGVVHETGSFKHFKSKKARKKNRVQTKVAKWNMTFNLNPLVFWIFLNLVGVSVL